MNTLKNSKRAKNPFRESNIFSKYMFSFLNKLFAEGYKRQLDKNDILKNRKEDSADVVTKNLEKKWNDQLQKRQRGKKPSFFRALLLSGCKKWVISATGLFIMEMFKIVQTIFLKFLLEVITSDNFGKNNDAYIWAAALVLSIFMQWAFAHQAFFISERMGVNFRSAALGLVYKKALHLRHCKLGAISTGHVVTLVASDAHKLLRGLELSSFIFIAPVKIVLAIIILYRELGPSCLVGIGLLILFAPMQSWIGKLFAYFRVRTVKKTDERVNAMNEIIASMQVTKMNTWEEAFATIINKIRKEESHRILKSALMRAINVSMYGSSTPLVLFATFSVYYYYGDGITLAKLYLTISVFFAIRLAVVLYFPIAIQMAMEFYVSSKRIEKFLLQEEMEKEEPKEKLEKISDPYVSFDNVTASWEGEYLKPILENISFKADKKNSFIIIHGPVGSGKTSLLMAALNEIIIKKGTVDVRGTVAYASQQSWIFSGTVRQNITFGEEFDKKRFHQVVEACALQTDLDSFENGDMEYVGERGVSLSGGQKARICLARAVYRDADIYFLDDPLSAVDTKVAKHIVEKCIKTLLKDKIVLLVTHQVQYLTEATQVITLEENSSTIDELTFTDPNGNIAFKPVKNKEEHNIGEENEDENELLGIPNDSSRQRTDTVTSKMCEETEEYRAEGAIPLKLYLKYFSKGIGWFHTIALFASLIFGQVLLTFTDYWVGEWATSEEERHENKTIDAKFIFTNNPDNNVYLFTGLVATSSIFNAFRTIYIFAALVKCSRRLHNLMFKAVLKAPMHFFDTNPIGQILNRFSRDIYLMDDEIPWIFNDFVQLGLFTLAIVTLNCISVPYLLVLVVPLIVFFVFARRYYMSTSREVKRLEAIARSPLYTHVSATLSGVTSIRSFKKSDVMVKEFNSCLDYQTEAWVTFLMCSRWFSMRLDLMVVLFAMCTVFAPVIVASYVHIDPGLIGVSLAYTLNLCDMFQWCVRQSAEVDNMMTSVERVFEYTELEPEPDVSESKDLPKDWPSEGEITADSVFYSYHESLPPSLKDLKLTIKAKEKVGIVGRTGAGKSSLISMLFRLGKTRGRVAIDGVDIGLLKLKDLRSSISVIPQDPVLFGGTLRKNLDPFNDYSDEDIWNALEEVQLKPTVQEFKDKLQTEITESGSNLSVGERQLFCLARALLKHNKILMIDEATANVDLATDYLIQKTIREKFKECTVLTIAHRLNTVMDSDRILVMDDGHIVEFDKPSNLLNIQNGYLRKLVDQTGPTEAAKLEKLANEKKSEVIANVEDIETKF